MQATASKLYSTNLRIECMYLLENLLVLFFLRIKNLLVQVLTKFPGRFCQQTAHELHFNIVDTPPSEFRNGRTDLFFFLL